MGISELVLQIVSQFGVEESKMLLNNIIVTGGGSQLHNISQRIKRDLVQNTPQHTAINVTTTDYPLDGVYRGMVHIYNTSKNNSTYD